jgi:hypothetical protein
VSEYDGKQFVGIDLYGWYWAVDALVGVGASVHLAHPLGVKAS